MRTGLGLNISKMVRWFGSNGTPIRNDIWRTDWSRDVIKKGQGRDPDTIRYDTIGEFNVNQDIFGAHYPENAWI